jgi:hypothetical protein
LKLFIIYFFTFLKQEGTPGEKIVQIEKNKMDFDIHTYHRAAWPIQQVLQWPS